MVRWACEYADGSGSKEGKRKIKGPLGFASLFVHYQQEAIKFCSMLEVWYACGIFRSLGNIFDTNGHMKCVTAKGDEASSLLGNLRAR